VTKKLHARNLLIRDSFTDATAVQSDATMTTNYSLEMTRLEARVATELPRDCFTPGRVETLQASNRGRKQERVDDAKNLSPYGSDKITAVPWDRSDCPGPLPPLIPPVGGFIHHHSVPEAVTIFHSGPCER